MSGRLVSFFTVVIVNVGLFLPSAVAQPNQGRPSLERAASYLNEAVNHSEAITSSEQRCWVLLNIAESQRRIGTMALAQETLDRVELVAETFSKRESYLRDMFLGLIAQVRARADSPELAMKTLAKARPDQHGFARMDIATAYIKAGKLRAALKIALSFRPLDEMRDHLLAHVAYAAAQSKDRELADEALAAIHQPAVRAELLTTLSYESHTAGNKEEARQEMEAAVAQAEQALPDVGGSWGGLVGCWSDDDPPEHPRDAALAYIARTLACRGEQSGADDALGKIQNPATVEDTKAGIVSCRSRDGDFEGAQRMLSRIERMTCRSSALAGIAGAYAEIGNFDQALKTADEIEWADQQALTIERIAIAQIQAGRMSDARQTLERALRVTNALGDRRSRAQGLTTLSRRFFEAGAHDRALQMVQAARPLMLKEHKEGLTRNESNTLLQNLAEVYVLLSDVDGAVRVIGGLQPEEFLRALSTIARVQVELGREAEAVSWVQTLLTPSEKANALVGLAEGVLNREGLPK